MFTALMWVTVSVGIFFILGTLINQSRHPHWFIRGWDFPRMQTALLAFLVGAVYAVVWSQWRVWDWLFFAGLAGCISYQVYHIYPYTPLVRKMVLPAHEQARESSLRLMISNVLMENRQFDRLLDLVVRVDPDVFFAVEVDQRWVDALQSLEESYPYVVKQPQENMYGMVLFSRLKLIDPQVRFIVQDDIPSIHTEVELPCRERVMFHGLHPRPPEPLRNQDAAPRDAELVLVGREIEQEDQPVVVAGDLNDVAWSRTTTLFLRISRMLDPRVGRGFYNTWSARSYFWRFPLDHIFHSECFKLIDLRVLEDIGSDHFPVLAELHYHPEAAAVQEAPKKEPEHEEEAQEKINRQESESQRLSQSPQRRTATT